MKIKDTGLIECMECLAISELDAVTTAEQQEMLPVADVIEGNADSDWALWEDSVASQNSLQADSDVELDDAGGDIAVSKDYVALRDSLMNQLGITTIKTTNTREEK